MEDLIERKMKKQDLGEKWFLFWRELGENWLFHSLVRSTRRIHLFLELKGTERGLCLLGGSWEGTAFDALEKWSRRIGEVKKEQIPLARRYALRTFSETPSSQRDSTPSKPPSPSMRSSLLRSTGPSLSLRMMPLRRRMIRAHMRKERRRKRKVERTIRMGSRMRSASDGESGSEREAANWAGVGMIELEGESD